jgi:hypothetical protein
MRSSERTRPLKNALSQNQSRCVSKRLHSSRRDQQGTATLKICQTECGYSGFALKYRLMATPAQIELFNAEKVATLVSILQVPNGRRRARHALRSA